jgi:zinc-finger of transposase IS204/IS1001/IS1096/IS1165
MPDPTTWSMPLKGVRLLYMHETGDSTLIGLETESRSVPCPACGSAAVVGYGKMTWRIRDLPVRDKPVFLEIRRRRLRCRDCLVTFNEPVPHISENHRATTRLVQRIWKLAVRLPFAVLSKKLGMDEKTIRNIFQEIFNVALTQFKATIYPPAPSALAIHLPLIRRKKCALWINLDQCTLIEMDARTTPETVRQTLQRVAANASGSIYVPPDAALIKALQAVTSTPLLLHPGSMRAACSEVIETGKAIGDTEQYVDTLTRFVAAKSEPEAVHLWQHLALPPEGLRAPMQAMICATELLSPGCFIAFGQPDHACDGLIDRLISILNTGFSKRSYDVICAIALFDKNLQKTVRTLIAKDGVQLGYEKLNYGTSIPKLLARLDNLMSKEQEQPETR